MFEIATESVRLVLGVSFGAMAMVFGIMTIRMITSGKDAYRANQRISPKNPSVALAGRLKSGVADTDRRASHGIAVNLNSGKLEAQRRLSTEAVDDVIGRRTA
ncbi:MAG: hypothetical protein AAFO57_07980 [Pseudomonadota bacterium]